MKTGYCYLLSLVLVLLDQLSKCWISKHLVPYEPMVLLPMLNITLAYNTGAAFSFLSNSGDWHLWFFAGLSCSISIALIVWLWRAVDQTRMQSLGVSLILGGALGNLVDRGLHGYVVDFIDVYYRQHHFATFNWADSFICIGAGLLLLDLLTSGKKAK